MLLKLFFELQETYCTETRTAKHTLVYRFIGVTHSNEHLPCVTPDGASNISRKGADWKIERQPRKSFVIQAEGVSEGPQFPENGDAWTAARR